MISLHALLSPSLDISHLNTTQNEPIPTLDINDLCTSFKCENDGVCILHNGKAECRCPSGEDWWYMGERCEKRGSTRDTIVIAASSTVAVFALMLIITLVSVYCTRKKYHKETGSRTANTTLENSLRATTTEPARLELVLHNKRSHRNEKPAHRNEE
ncbi:hypothetical protein J1605_018011 [Eschrichtius robustus]|uniref:EGF-like domain-containing protein n=1 Tax=Eschrichtius robustus TaxID=9764 RepID=A0AB34HYY5_ESCRO|nr:hypothetical protein J1605_018011 [Eschrichtius robustus]